MPSAERLRVAVVHADILPIPPVLGGAIGQIVYETVQGMPEIDWTVISRWDRALEDVGLDARFHYVDIDASVAKVWRTFVGQQKIIDTDAELRRFCYVDGVAEILECREPNIVQVENRPAFVPYLKKRLPHAKFVLYMHNEADCADERIIKGIDLCDRLVCVSHDLADRYLEKFPHHKNKLVVIHNGVDSLFWHPKHGKHQGIQQIRNRYSLNAAPTILYVGRIVPEKGLHCLIDAMEVVWKSCREARLVIVGSSLFGLPLKNSYDRKLKQRAQALGDQVVFTGFLNAKQLRHYYALANVLVVPSLWKEPFGKVIVEAMAMATPVVASSRGGIPEIIKKNKGGILIDNPSNASLLAKKILRFLDDRGYRLKVGRKGRKHVQNTFSLKQRWKRLQVMYDLLVR